MNIIKNFRYYRRQMSCLVKKRCYLIGTRYSSEFGMTNWIHYLLVYLLKNFKTTFLMYLSCSYRKLINNHRHSIHNFCLLFMESGTPWKLYKSLKAQFTDYVFSKVIIILPLKTSLIMCVSIVLSA
jgi:hypothetical protein